MELNRSRYDYECDIVEQDKEEIYGILEIDSLIQNHWPNPDGGNELYKFLVTARMGKFLSSKLAPKTQFTIDSVKKAIKYYLNALKQ